MAYRFAAWKLPEDARGYLTAACVAGMAALHLALRNYTQTRWSIQQIKLTTGADQLWVFDDKYNLGLYALLLVWGLTFAPLVSTRGLREVVWSVPFQFCVVS